MPSAIRSNLQISALARVVIKAGLARTSEEAQRVLLVVLGINCMLLLGLVWWMHDEEGAPLTPQQIENAGNPNEIEQR